MTEPTAETATKTGSDAKDQTPPKAKAAKAAKVQDAEPDWVDAREFNENGQQVDEHQLPLAKVARAMALAAAGKSSDPGKIVTDEEIAAYDPKAAEADRDAIAQHIADKAETARKEAEKQAEADAAAAQTEKE